ncbi:hypothetical protein DFQ27_002009, partial [Actinomortierella ambigua]
MTSNMMQYKLQLPLFSPQAPLLLPRSLFNTHVDNLNNQPDNTRLARYVLYPSTPRILFPAQATPPLRSLHMPLSKVPATMRQSFKRALEVSTAGHKAREEYSNKRRRVQDIMDTSDDDAEDNPQ